MKTLKKLLFGLAAIFIFLVFIALVSPRDSKNNPEKAEAKPIEISAKNLYEEYEKNEISADTKFKSHFLEIQGKIDVIGKDILNAPYITLTTNNIVGKVQCMLSQSETEKASKLLKNTNITVIGNNRGKTLTNILIDDCKIK